MAKHKGKGPPPPPPPKEELITFAKSEPDRDVLEKLLVIARENGVRPGLLGALIQHESAGTWNPEIRPSKAGAAPVKVTVSGKVKGLTGSSAVGLAQYTDPRWLMSMHDHGERIIEQVGLEGTPEAKAIRSLNQKIDSRIGRGVRLTWDRALALSNDKAFKTLPEYQEVMRLRSDPTAEIPLQVLIADIGSYARDLRASGVEVNTTTIYASHHKSPGFVREISKNPNSVPDVSEAEARANGNIFIRPDGTRKTGAEVMQSYVNVVSDAHAANFERKYFGHDFGKAPEKPVLRKVADAAGHSFSLRSDLVFPKLSNEEFLQLWRKPSPPVQDPAVTGGVIAALQKLGENFGKKTPQSLDDKRLQMAISNFKERVGLPFPSRGLDLATVDYMLKAGERVDHFAELRQQQLSGRALDLVDWKKKLPQTKAQNPALAEGVEKTVLQVKTALKEQGLLSLPRGAKEFKPVIDDRMISALEQFQTANGLASTRGKLDAVTRSLLLRRPFNMGPRSMREDQQFLALLDEAAPPPAMVAEAAPASESASAKAVHVAYEPAAPRSLHQGNRVVSEEVREVQQALERLGYGRHLGAQGSDGRYGPRTEQAVARFALDHHLSHRSGEISPELQELLRQQQQVAQGGPREPFNDTSGSARIAGIAELGRKLDLPTASAEPSGGRAPASGNNPRHS